MHASKLRDLTDDKEEVAGEASIEVTYPKLIELRLYIISSILITASMVLPFTLHQFGFAGQVFMPIYLLALLAGLVYGWNCGLLVGILTPIISYSFTQMPMFPILPFVIIKSSLLGLISGLMVEQMYGKKLFMIAAVAILFSQIIGNLLLYLATMNLQMALTDAVTGFPGIILLFVAIPYFSIKIRHYERKIIRRYSSPNPGMQN